MTCRICDAPTRNRLCKQCELAKERGTTSCLDCGTETGVVPLCADCAGGGR